MYNCTLNMFCSAKLSMLCGFTKGVSVNDSYLWINDILEYNLPYVQSGFDTCTVILSLMVSVICSSNKIGSWIKTVGIRSCVGIAEKD